MHFEKTSCYNKKLKKFEQKSILVPGSGLIVAEACFLWKYEMCTRIYSITVECRCEGKSWAGSEMLKEAKNKNTDWYIGKMT